MIRVTLRQCGGRISHVFELAKLEEAPTDNTPLTTVFALDCVGRRLRAGDFGGYAMTLPMT